MFQIRKSIDIDFSHSVEGHNGACINIHGHTWKFEVTAEARELSDQGFVVDFKDLKSMVLEPVHILLDHSHAMSGQMYDATCTSYEAIGRTLIATRGKKEGCSIEGGYKFRALHEGPLNGAVNMVPGGIKLSVFNFIPTSEKLAQWLWTVARMNLADDRVSIAETRVYETLHPVESVAIFRP